MVNRVVIVGRLTRDPELKKLEGNSSVLNFSLALNRQYSREEKTDYIDCTAWNKTAELMDQYLGKGSLIAVDGKLQQDSYVDQNGQNRSRIVVVADSVQFLESRAKAEERLNATSNYKPPLNPNIEDSSIDEDLPW